MYGQGEKVEMNILPQCFSPHWQLVSDKGKNYIFQILSTDAFCTQSWAQIFSWPSLRAWTHRLRWPLVWGRHRRRSRCTLWWVEAGYELYQRGHSGDGQEAGRLASAGGGSSGRWGGSWGNCTGPCTEIYAFEFNMIFLDSLSYQFVIGNVISSS